MAQGLCVDCGFDYSKKVIVESIPWMIKQTCEASGIYFFNIAVLDISHLPAFSTTTDISPSIIHQTKCKTETWIIQFP